MTNEDGFDPDEASDQARALSVIIPDSEATQTDENIEDGSHPSPPFIESPSSPNIDTELEVDDGYDLITVRDGRIKPAPVAASLVLGTGEIIGAVLANAVLSGKTMGFLKASEGFSQIFVYSHAISGGYVISNTKIPATYAMLSNESNQSEAYLNNNPHPRLRIIAYSSHAATTAATLVFMGSVAFLGGEQLIEGWGYGDVLAAKYAMGTFSMLCTVGTYSAFYIRTSFRNIREITFIQPSSIDKKALLKTSICALPYMIADFALRKELLELTAEYIFESPLKGLSTTISLLCVQMQLTTEVYKLYKILSTPRHSQPPEYLSGPCMSINAYRKCTSLYSPLNLVVVPVFAVTLGVNLYYVSYDLLPEMDAVFIHKALSGTLAACAATFVYAFTGHDLVRKALDTVGLCTSHRSEQSQQYSWYDPRGWFF